MFCTLRPARPLVVLAAGAFALGSFAVGCGKVEQVRPPRIEDTGDEDIAAEPEGKDLAPVEEKKLTPEEQKQACCKECVTGLDNDRTGQKAEEIPCADFTAELSETCLKWFRDNPTKASDARTCSTGS